MKIEDLHSLIFNPVWTAAILASFLSGAKLASDKGVRFDILFLVLPLIFDLRFRKVLCSKRSDSTLNNLLDSAGVRVELLRFDKRVIDYREITRLALMMLRGKVSIDSGRVYLHESIDYKKFSGDMRDYLKASCNLGSIFSKDPDGEIFLRFGALL